MNANFRRLALALSAGVKSRTKPLPVRGNLGDVYIDPATGRLAGWTDANGGEWDYVTPGPGFMVLVQDTKELVYFSELSKWEVSRDLDRLATEETERQLNAYLPGRLKPSGYAMRHAAAMELTIPGGAPGSIATLEKAPVGGSLTLKIRAGNKTGSIKFNSGSKSASFHLSGDAIIQPAREQSAFTVSEAVSIQLPENTRKAAGLSITIACKVRGLGS